jgi:hypothetical protein
MNYKTIMICALLTGSMQQTWGMDEDNAALNSLNTLVSQHAALCGFDEFESVMPRIAMFRKNLKKSNNPDMSLVNEAAENLTKEFESALKAYHENHN